MTTQRLTWEQIKEKYPQQQVGLQNVEYVGQKGGVIAAADVVCTSETTDVNEMAWQAIQGNLTVCYTTFDEDVMFSSI